VQQGAFREDLYYRLAVFPIQIPPLRERKQDVPHLVRHFLQKLAPEQSLRVTPEAMDLLQAYDWPGNVRELENAIERAFILADNQVIDARVLPVTISAPIQRLAAHEVGSRSDPGTLMQIEKQAIVNALQKANGNQTAAARLLGIPRHVLLYRMKKLGIG